MLWYYSAAVTPVTEISLIVTYQKVNSKLKTNFLLI